MPDAPLDYQRNGPDEQSARGLQFSFWQGIGIIGLATLLLWFFLGPHDGRPRERANQVKCASNLRQIGQAIVLYCSDAGGHYPSDLTAVLTTQQISSEAFTCPSGDDTKASSLAQLSQPGHCSYIYVGSNLTWSNNAAGDKVVAFDGPADHMLQGGNVLYDDGHVDWVLLPQLMDIINDLAAGRNPPTSKTTMTQRMAEQDYKKNWQSRMPALKQSGWRISATQPSR